jgi:hypothetical protein
MERNTNTRSEGNIRTLDRMMKNEEKVEDERKRKMMKCRRYRYIIISIRLSHH